MRICFAVEKNTKRTGIKISTANKYFKKAVSNRDGLFLLDDIRCLSTEDFL